MKKVICTVLIFVFFAAVVSAEMQYGQLNVLAKNGKYKIFLDEEQKGETPIKMQNIIAGTHLLRAVDVNSLRTVIDKSITVNADQLTTIVIEEEMTTGAIKSNSQTAQTDKIMALSQYNSEKKEPGFATLWSFLIIGAGQVYNGNWAKAGLLWLVALGSYSAAKASAGSGSSGVWAAIWLGSWVYSMFDAYAESEAINNNLKMKYGISSVELFDVAKLLTL